MAHVKNTLWTEGFLSSWNYIGASHPFPGQGKLRQLGQGSSIETLELSREFSRARNNRFDLLLEFDQSPVHCRFFPIHIYLHML
jgi:hypothetical protein